MTKKFMKKRIGEKKKLVNKVSWWKKFLGEIVLLAKINLLVKKNFWGEKFFGETFLVWNNFLL